jgi:60 kDa SS-A/Ro ribonucleoprotein
MSINYAEVVSPKATSQREKVPGVEKQKRNNAGGVSFKINKWDYLMRFLILGTEGGTYYVNQEKLTVSAAKNVQKCIDEDGIKTVDTIVQVSLDGRAASNDPAIFALAMCASAKNDVTRVYALSKINSVCRISTHLFHFVDYIKTMRGFGRSLRSAIAKWYLDKTPEDLSYQMLKYKQRDGWSHRDLLRLSHPVPLTKEYNSLFNYAVGKNSKIPNVSSYAYGAQFIKELTTPKTIADCIVKYNLTREVIPTEFLNSPVVWEALLEKMPITALIRNLGKMASMNMHQPFSDAVNKTVSYLTDENKVIKGRVHPLSIINALSTYSTGYGIKGNLRWTPNQAIINALEDAFYISFKNVEPSNKRIMVALDVSGSMTSPIAGSHLSCRDASGVMAMVTMRTEPQTFVTGFTGIGGGSYYGYNNLSGLDSIKELAINGKMSLTEVIKTISGLPFSRTDCSLPMQYCIKNDIDLDAIIIYTDNETWAGNIHPWQALDKLEQKLGHIVYCVVVGMTATRFSIARPDYNNMLDVVGFDTNTPQVISNFIR